MKFVGENSVKIKPNKNIGSTISSSKKESKEPTVKTEEGIITLRLRLKDKHKYVLCAKAEFVNFVWNFSQDLALKILERENRFASAYDIAKYTAGASKEGIDLPSQTIQAVTEQYVKSRKQFKKRKLAWRVSNQKSSKRSLGWIPFKESTLRYKNGQLFFSGIDQPLSLWDSYNLNDYNLKSGSISEDSRGRWYINIVATPKVKPWIQLPLFESETALDLGLKHVITSSDGVKIEAPRFFMEYEELLAVSQRANKSRQLKNIHAKVANKRKDFWHKLTYQISSSYQLVIIGDLKVSNLNSKEGGKGKSFADAGLHIFKTQALYKCANAGGLGLVVNESYSTVTCHVCKGETGPTGEAGLRIREWVCRDCGISHDRDINAACNIFRFGKEELRKQALAKRQRVPGGVVLSEDLAAIFINQTTDMGLGPVSSPVFRMGHHTPDVGIPVLTAQAAADLG